MGVFEEFLENNSHLFMKFLEFVEGKNVKTRIDLSGLEMKFGETTVKFNGEIILNLSRKSK